MLQPARDSVRSWADPQFPLPAPSDGTDELQQLRIRHPAEPLDLKLLRLHLIVAGKGLRRIGREELRPFAQLVLMDVQVPRRLRDTHSAILDQANRLDLELAPKSSSPHTPSPLS
jgi:hypothetical protein